MQLYKSPGIVAWLRDGRTGSRGRAARAAGSGPVGDRTELAAPAARPGGPGCADGRFV